MNLVFFLEERSMRRFLEGLLPRILPAEVQVTYIVHDGKTALEASLVNKLKHWGPIRDERFVVVRDQDLEDCRDVRSRLLAKCREGGQPDALVRVACRELEAWYFGDLAAVERVYGVGGLVKLQGKANYRDPDLIPSPSRELALLVPRFAKSDARELGEAMDLEGCRSASFQALIRGIRRMTAV